jgi:hypothetical protein
MKKAPAESRFERMRLGIVNFTIFATSINVENSQLTAELLRRSSDAAGSTLHLQQK